MEQLEIPLENTGFVIKQTFPIKTCVVNTFAVQITLTNGFSMMGFHQELPNSPLMLREDGEHLAYLNAVEQLSNMNPSSEDWNRYQEYCVKELCDA